MRTIHKYPIDIDTLHPILVSMREGSDIIHFDLQDGIPTIWAIVDTSRYMSTFEFYLVGTGWDLANLGPCVRHIGSWQREGFVWHLFRR